jgi:hypothetical protein
MARKSAEAAGKKTGRKLLEAARKHQDALLAGGLAAAVVDQYENALRGVDSVGKEPNAAAQTLVRDLTRQIGEFQAAIRKEFPGNASFHSYFRAGEPVPTEARALLQLGREVAKAAPEFASNLIRHALNAATVKQLEFLCDQLAKELGGADPVHEAEALEAQILTVARRVFEGRPELSAFGR